MNLSGGEELGGANCPDPNNRDTYNKYWLYADADGTTYLRDTSKQVTTAQHSYIATAPILYFQVSWQESFTYNNFGQLLTHTLYANGPVETYHYDAAGRADTF